MRKNIVQSGNKAPDGRIYIDYDWFEQGIPGNVEMAENVYIDTSYGFSAFHSLLPDAMSVGNGSGCYDRATFVTGEKGKIHTGEFNIWNGSTFICNKEIKVGNHCMFAWGSVITDSWINEKHFPVHQRRKMLEATLKDSLRILPLYKEPKPILIEDNVWVGFDAVVLPGVKLGKGCIAGSKSVVTEDVPAYAIVAGNPATIIRYLDADDTEEARAQAFAEYLSPVHAQK
jgi:acetyltransferase-like isoleucine patch superfamily enzyme